MLYICTKGQNVVMLGEALLEDIDAIYPAYFEIFDLGRGSAAFDCIHVAWNNCVRVCVCVCVLCFHVQECV